MHHIEDSLYKFEKLRHRQYWWYDEDSPELKQEETESDLLPNYYDKVRSKHMLLVCPGGDVLKQRKHDSLLWRELLFTDPVWREGDKNFLVSVTGLHIVITRDGFSGAHVLRRYEA